MEDADKSAPAAAAEHSTTAAAETTGTSKRHKRHKSRDAKQRRLSSDGSEGAPNQETTRTESATKSRKKRSRKSPEDGSKAVPIAAPDAVAPANQDTVKQEPVTQEPTTQEPSSQEPSPLPPAVALPEKLAAAAPARAQAPPSDKEGAVPPTEERKPDDVLLVSIATCAVMVTGMALVVAGIVIGLMMPRPEGGCPPLDHPLEDGTVLVATNVGRLIGRTMTVDGARLSRFYGVPFAESTEGERRFSVPVPLSGGNPCRLRNSLEPREPCAQLGPNDSLVGSEDCLHINVWAPETPPPTPGSRALVVALESDWFESGSNDHPDWPQLAAKGDVVVMAPNHRLGVLGFLHPPNSGEKDAGVDDVISALMWARENAAAFQADPNQLVVMGRGSGAYLLSMALRRMPNDTALRALYHGLVFGSLLPLEPEDPSEPFRTLAEGLHCNSTAKTAWLACFRAAPLQDLLVTSRASRLPMRFAPRLVLDFPPKSAAAWPTTVLAGSDATDVAALFRDVIVPVVKTKANATSAAAVLDYVMEEVFHVPKYARDFVRKAVQAPSVEEISHSLSYLMGLCPTLNAAKAVPEGFHYHYEAVRQSAPFRPPLGIGQVAQFAAKGTVPALGYGSPWPPLKTTPKTRLIEQNGRENFTSLDAQCKLPF